MVNLTSSLVLGLLAASTAVAASPHLTPAASAVRNSSSPSDQSGSVSNKPISFVLNRDTKEVPSDQILRRRDQDDFDVQIYNFSSVSYNIALDIGKPAQTVKVIIDTGSSELWVNPDCSKAQSLPQQHQCLRSGHYTVNDSSTGKVSTLQSRIQYGIGAVSLNYVSDDIALPGSDVELSQVVFGDAYSSHDMNQGILGLSFGYKYNMGYRSIIDELVAQNFSKIRGFGMALGSLNNSEGGMLTFGGIDTKKYAGKLHTEPIIPPSNSQELWRYWVQMSSVGVTLNETSPSAFENSSLLVFFDSGSTLSYLPKHVVSSIADKLGAQYDQSHQMYELDCGSQGSIDFTFGNYTVNVAASDFLWRIGNGKCYLGVEASDSAALLGDSFLRSVYVVYDMDTPAIHFAPYVDCGSNPQLIPAGANKTVEFIGECNDNGTGNTESNVETELLSTSSSRSVDTDQVSGGSSKNVGSSADRPVQCALMAAVVAVGVLAAIM